MAFLDRTRADSFGANAELYDQARPSYPPELVADLLAGGPADIVDVGSGTGKVARLLVGDGRRVVGLEPDARMAAVARSHGLDVEVATFEAWDPAGRTFDLLTAGQSWHWVEPEAGAVKAAEVLRAGGRFAAFWNRMSQTPDVVAVNEDVYGRWAPQLVRSSVALGGQETIVARRTPAAAGLEAAGFVDIDNAPRPRYTRTVAYRPSEWVALLATHSDHQTLEPAIRQPLLEELQTRLEALGPRIDIEIATELLTAVRPGA